MDAVVQLTRFNAFRSTLDFDVNGINLLCSGKDFFSLRGGKDKVIVSALLWQVDANELEHYAPPAPKVEEPNKPNDPIIPNSLWNTPQKSKPAEEQIHAVPMPDRTLLQI
jgi:hypothetical protein